MALPAEYNTVEVRGKYVYRDGRPARGRVRFVASAVASAPVSNVVVLPSPMYAALDVAGAFSISLPATDDPDVSPTGWTYGVTEMFEGGRNFHIDVPLASAGSGIEIADVAPADENAEGAHTFVTQAAFEAYKDDVAVLFSGNGMSGTGSPEGVKTAAVGTRYADTAATRGAVTWVKASGSGNTGWKVVYGDTGWRSVVALIAANWEIAGTAPMLQLRRQNNLVTVQFRVRASATAAGTLGTQRELLTVPAGFTGSGFLPLGVVVYNGGVISGILSALGSSARLDINAPGNGTAIVASTTACYGQASYITNDAWPSALPGVAV